MAPANQALERRGSSSLATPPAPVEGLIQSAQDLVVQIEKARQHFHVLSPVSATSQIADGYAAAMSVVAIDLNPGSPDVYRDKLMAEDEVALTKVSLMRIAAALGVSWTKAERLDNGRKANYWNIRVEGVYRAPDGSKQTISASKEVDLSDGSAQAKAMTDKQLAQARLHGQQLAETKAQLRAIRTFGIVAKYKKAQLAKPFVAVRFSYVPDTSDPEIKRMVAASELGIAHLLYGAPQTQGRPELSEGGELPAELGGADVQSGPKSVGGGKGSPSASAPKEATFDDDEPEADDRPRHGIAHVLERNANGDWPVQLTDGTTLSTNDKAIARAASEAGKAGKAVVVESAQGRIEELTVLDEPAPAAAAGGDGGGGSDDEATADDGQRYVKLVKEAVKTGKNAKGAWALSFIVLSTGEEVSTFSSTDVAKAKEAEAKGWPVRVQIDDSDPERPRLSSIELIDPRQGSLLNDGKGAKY